jgi:decaprenylphospho-beta-D-erythro-pentofuranosid-2-ulose 2-reductase
VNKNTKKIVIVGATSAIAEQCIRVWAKEAPAEIVLIGRDRDRLQIVAADLAVRTKATVVRVVEANFIDPSKVQETVSQICLGVQFDTVLIAQGMLPDQNLCQNDLKSVSDALSINAISPVLFAEAFARNMEKANKGTLVIIGSVAGDRGRKSNYVYGAAKGLVERYAEGLQHRLTKTAVRVVLVKPGPTDTPMTAHLKQAGASLATSEEVAIRIVRGIEQGKTLIYAPPKWALIMFVIRNIPKFIFNKIDI